MYLLRLIALHCRKTEDVTGPDEAYLLVQNRRVWGPNSINDDETEDLRGVEPIPFRKKVGIALYDEDSEVPWDDDDHLGTTFARAKQAGEGEQRHRFKGDGADYRLSYEVLRVKKKGVAEEDKKGR